MKFYQRYGKRISDLILSWLVLLLGWPIFLIIAFLIKISSSGPVIFPQKRIGKNGRVFTLFKFRTMVKNAPRLKKKYVKLNEADGPVFKIRNDPRFINGLAKFLARSALDELPNLFNVLRGEMSWVGPRPLPVDEAKEIAPEISDARESVLPGITSSWVVSGSHQLKFNTWMSLDLDYAKNFNFLTDFKILGKTLLFCLKISVSLLNPQEKK